MVFAKSGSKKTKRNRAGTAVWKSGLFSSFLNGKLSFILNWWNNLTKLLQRVVQCVNANHFFFCCWYAYIALLIHCQIGSQMLMVSFYDGNDGVFERNHSSFMVHPTNQTEDSCCLRGKPPSIGEGVLRGSGLRSALIIVLHVWLSTCCSPL